MYKKYTQWVELPIKHKKYTQYGERVMSERREKKRRTKPLDWLFEAPYEVNLADQFDDETLAKIGSDVVHTFDVDVNARSEWDRRSDSALKFAKQAIETKNFPWPGCSNVCHPLITTAAIQFGARAFPEIVKGNRVVKCQITGDDPTVKPMAKQLVSPSGEGGPMGPGPQQPQVGQQGPPQQMGPPTITSREMPPSATQGLASRPVSEKRARADRIIAHMNYQLTQEMPEWGQDMDRLLHIVPVLGQCYKKVYHNDLYDRHDAELVLPTDCYVNAKARSILSARRITHRLWIYDNDVWERMESGQWLDVDLGLPISLDGDPDSPHEFLEQHRFEDLDGDGYKEPYIVTVHKDSGKVVRIFARWDVDGVKIEVKKGASAVTLKRIEPDNYFVHYFFLPNPDGSINYLGFGQLLEPINAAVNASLNQLIDSGTQYNAGGGFLGRGVKMRGGTFSFRPGEWKFLDAVGGALRDNMVPLPIKEPSVVLFQLLGFLVQAGRDITSVQDVLVGDAKLAANMPVGTAMALVEQGLKVFTGIYKRIYMSLTDELKKLYVLNARYVDDEVSFVLAGHPEMFVGRSDYIEGDLLVTPVADPDLASDMQRMLKTQALKESTGRPGINEIELTRRLVKAIQPEDVEDVLLTDGQLDGSEPMPWNPPPSPEVIVAQAKAGRMQQQAQESQIRLAMDAHKFQLEIELLVAEIAKKKADAILALARADGEISDTAGDPFRVQLEAFKSDVDTLERGVKMSAEMMKAQMAQQAQAVGGQPQGELKSASSPPSPPRGPAPIPGRAEGGPVQAGQPYVVGELGPEVIVPQQSGQVIPNSGTKLTEGEEQKFQSWIKALPWYSQFKERYGEEPNLNDSQYDYRAAWKNGVIPQINLHD